MSKLDQSESITLYTLSNSLAALTSEADFACKNEHIYKYIYIYWKEYDLFCQQEWTVQRTAAQPHTMASDMLPKALRSATLLLVITLFASEGVNAASSPPRSDQDPPFHLISLLCITLNSCSYKKYLNKQSRTGSLSHLERITWSWNIFGYWSSDWESQSVYSHYSDRHYIHTFQAYILFWWCALHLLLSLWCRAVPPTPQSAAKSLADAKAKVCAD